MMRTYIRVKYQREGFHRWRQAPAHRSYLAALHRHLFKVTLSLETTRAGRNEREIEFHDVQDWLEGTASVYIPSIDADSDNSCEQMAYNIAQEAITRFPFCPSGSVEVSEDGEFSGTIVWALGGSKGDGK